MGIRKIRVLGDEVLRKISKPVPEMTARNRSLIGDMLDTMYDACGVGLAAPQVGILKRIFVIDIGEGPVVFINPEITATSGTQTDREGCLSIPGKHADVTRPMQVTVKAQDIYMQPFELTAEGLMARAICHENDHLDGKMYADIADGPLQDNEDDEE